MEAVKRKNLTRKSNAVYRSYHVQLMGWMHLMTFAQIIHS